MRDAWSRPGPRAQGGTGTMPAEPGLGQTGRRPPTVRRMDAALCLVAQSCPTLCDPVDCRPPGSSVHAVLQARRLEWVAMPSSGENG